MDKPKLTPDGKIEYDKPFDGYTADKPLFEANRTPTAAPDWKPVVLTDDKKK